MKGQLSINEVILTRSSSGIMSQPVQIMNGFHNWM